MKHFNKFLPYFIIYVLALSPLITSAQPPDPCDDVDLPPCPIDGGLSLLIAAGIGIGAKKAYNKKRNKTTVEI
ncbi:MAG: hypothetical protein ABIW38_01015 [Ferruginibacter sp.]